MRCHTRICGLLHMDHADDGWASDVTLALRAGGGAAHRALGELHTSRAAWVADVALRALPGRRDLALDAAQESWIRVAARPAHCCSAPELEAWMRRVVVSAAIDLLRRDLRQRARATSAAAREHTRARVAASDPIDRRAQTTADSESLERLRAQLDQLAAEERTLLDLRFRAGMTIAQLATALGIGPAAADSRLRRALERLRAHEETP